MFVSGYLQENGKSQAVLFRLINYRDPNRGECALHLAAQLNNEKVTQFLINLGAFPNVQDFKGKLSINHATNSEHFRDSQFNPKPYQKLDENSEINQPSH